MPNATSEQLQALQTEVQSLQQENKLLTDNRQLTSVVREFMLCCLDYAPKQAVRSTEWTSAFKFWVQAKYGKEFYLKLSPTGKEVIAEMDSVLKSRPELKKNRIYIDTNNQFGDLENAVLRPRHEQDFSSQFATVANYSSDIGE
jgi:regulator of replication initiation timing